MAEFGSHNDLLDCPELHSGVSFSCQSAEVDEQKGGVVRQVVIFAPDAVSSPIATDGLILVAIVGNLIIDRLLSVFELQI